MSKDDFFEIGKITGIHGVRGELRVLPLTDDPARYCQLDWVFVSTEQRARSINPEQNIKRPPEVMQKYIIEDVRFHKNMVLLKFEKVDFPEDAHRLIGMMLVIPREKAVKLPEYSYFICDIIGCEVKDEKGIILGTIENVLQTGSNDVYCVKRPAGGELLIPAMDNVVVDVDVQNKRIKVILPAGLDDE
ncbi:MAG: ribosome maturation factor RimM [Clostridiales bacterium]|nr:ribosome maturation factor RimM [Clostridiales bacterium]